MLLDFRGENHSFDAHTFPESTMLKPLLIALALLVSPTVLAQTYPAKPIRLIVPWPPGQAVDLASRIVAERLAAALGQPVVVENRPGAGGGVGTEYVTKSAPDGYTLLAGSSGPVSISPNLQKLAYSPARDLAPISLIGVSPFVLVTNPAFPVANAKELIDTVKASPGRFSYSSSGNASTAHLIIELFNLSAGLQATHVPYKGSAAALVDVMNGQIAYTFESLASVSSFVKGGKLRAHGISFNRRSGALPEVPPISEAAFISGFNIYAWFGYMAPAGTPRDVVARLSAEIQKVATQPELKERYASLGVEPMSSRPEEFARLLLEESDRYASIIKRANVRIEK